MNYLRFVAIIISLLLLAIIVKAIFANKNRNYLKSVLKKKSSPPKRVRFSSTITIVPPDPKLKKYDRFNPYLRMDVLRNSQLAREAGSNKALAYYSLNYE